MHTAKLFFVVWKRGRALGKQIKRPWKVIYSILLLCTALTNWCPKIILWNYLASLPSLRVKPWSDNKCKLLPLIFCGDLSAFHFMSIWNSKTNKGNAQKRQLNFLDFQGSANFKMIFLFHVTVPFSLAVTVTSFVQHCSIPLTWCNANDCSEYLLCTCNADVNISGNVYRHIFFCRCTKLFYITKLC